MADITVGVVGDEKSYYPLTKDITRVTNRGNVDIIRIPIGTNCNKLYLDGASVNDFTGKQDGMFLKPRKQYTISDGGHNIDTNFGNTDYGFRYGNFAYSGYAAYNPISSGLYKGNNHFVEWNVADNCVAINGMTVLFGVNLPIWSRIASGTGKVFRTSNVQYRFTDKANSNRIVITVSDYGFDYDPDPDDTVNDPPRDLNNLFIIAKTGERIWTRIECFRGDGVKILDESTTIKSDGSSPPSFTASRDSNLIMTDTLPEDLRTGGYVYNNKWINNSGVTNTQNNRYDRRLAANFEFQYKDSISSLYMSGYTNSSDVEDWGTDDYGSYDYYRVKLWEGDLGIRLGEFRTQCYIESNREHCHVSEGDAQNRVRPIEIMTNYCRFLYPSLYETFRVKQQEVTE